MTEHEHAMLVRCQAMLQAIYEHLGLDQPRRVTVAEMTGAFEGGPDSVTWLREQRDPNGAPATPEAS